MFEINAHEVLNEVLNHLSSISGSLADDPDDYIRNAAMSPDTDILRILLDESLAWISLKANPRWFTFESERDEIKIIVNCNEKHVKMAVTTLLVKRTVALWLRHSGLADAIVWENSSVTLADNLIKILKNYGSPNKRPVLPI